MFNNLNNNIKFRKPCKLFYIILFCTFICDILIGLIEHNIIRILFQEIIIILICNFFILLCVNLTLNFERKISCVDLLTGAYNRKKMYIDLTKLVKNNEEFELMFIDLNNFKEINDSYGHDAGDKLLEAFGKKASNLSDNIICYRIGGDEFVLISSKKKKSIENLDEFANLCEFNFSHGISKFPDDTVGIKGINDIIDKLLSEADKKMYKRKSKMKNNF